jgi:hypothetical protein
MPPTRAVNNSGVAKKQVLCQWTREVIESLGPRVSRVVQPPPVHLAKVSCLASCRRDWLIDAATIREILSRTADLTGSTIAEAPQRRDPATSVRRVPV